MKFGMETKVSGPHASSPLSTNQVQKIILGLNFLCSSVLLVHIDAKPIKLKKCFRESETTQIVLRSKKTKDLFSAIFTSGTHLKKEVSDFFTFYIFSFMFDALALILISTYFV
jgi:hypothetical protein